MVNTSLNCKEERLELLREILEKQKIKKRYYDIKSSCEKYYVPNESEIKTIIQSASLDGYVGETEDNDEEPRVEKESADCISLKFYAVELSKEEYTGFSDNEGWLDRLRAKIDRERVKAGLGKKKKKEGFLCEITELPSGSRF
jgi:hypothetical protein